MGVLHQEYAHPGDTTDTGVLERSGCHCQQAGWFPLFSCQGLLIRTFTTALQKYITITSILPRQEEREREAEETRVCVCLDERAWRGGVGRARKRSSSEPGEHKRERVRGGCLGAEGRRRTRRPAKRSGGAACERRALRFRMGQPVQSDVWTPPAESIGRTGGSGRTETSQ